MHDDKNYLSETIASGLNKFNNVITDIIVKYLNKKNKNIAKKR